jgi:hypothetical protein
MKRELAMRAVEQIIEGDGLILARVLAPWLILAVAWAVA